MNPIACACTAFSLIAGMLLLEGCATYRYARQKDSAYVRGMALPLWPPLGPNLSVCLIDIDHQTVGFVKNANSGRYLSPGRHSLLLSCTDDVSFSGDEDGPFPAIVRVEADFEANHTYQFTIEEGLHLLLWDDTGGVGKRIAVGIRQLGIDDMPTAEPISIFDFDGYEYLHPRFDRTDRRRKEPNHGRPDPRSTPNHPRPAGGGDHRSGGAHTGGGNHSGGGGHGGGHDNGGGGGGGHGGGGGSTGNSHSGWSNHADSGDRKK